MLLIIYNIISHSHFIFLFYYLGTTPHSSALLRDSQIRIDTKAEKKEQEQTETVVFELMKLGFSAPAVRLGKERDRETREKKKEKKKKNLYKHK